MTDFDVYISIFIHDQSVPLHISQSSVALSHSVRPSTLILFFGPLWQVNTLGCVMCSKICFKLFKQLTLKLLILIFQGTRSNCVSGVSYYIAKFERQLCILLQIIVKLFKFVRVYNTQMIAVTVNVQCTMPNGMLEMAHILII